MPDPMSKSDVEDVLASIRRLVTDDKRIDEHAAEPVSPDRLVLTPSLRVPEEDEFDAESGEESEDGGETWEFRSSHGISSHGAEEGVDNTMPGTPEMDTPLSPLMLDEPLIVGDDVRAFEEEGAIVSEQPTDEDHSSDDAPASEMRDDAETFEDAAQPDSHQEPDPEVDTSISEGDDNSDATAPDVEAPKFQGGEITIETLDEIDRDDVLEAEESEIQPANASLSAKIATLETLIAGRNDQWDPDDAGTDAYAGTEQPAMRWEDATEVLESDAQTGENEPVEIDVDAQSNDAVAFDDVLDEAALRELVSDIVREELQGALGERITRNVRKLVRREIHRALAAQELE